MPTGLSWAGFRDWFHYWVGGPLRRFGGNLLEYVPEPIRPRIRDRDRQQ